MATLVEDCVYHYYGGPAMVERNGGRAECPCRSGGTADDEFVQTARQVIVIPFRDGLMVGEDFSFDGQGTLEKVS